MPEQELENRQGIISQIIPFSCVDGPGNRFVVFLQGCNFACKNCHNPHTMNLCNSCGDCVPGCSSGALSLQGGRVQWAPDICESCDQCIDLCPSNSSPMVKTMTVADVLDQLLPAAPFLTGVTVSGGEATVQLKFVQALFRAIKAHRDLAHLDCLIDSNGYLPVPAWKKIISNIDGAMIDLKAMDDDLHRWLTGKSNQRVLETIRYLDSVNKLVEVRFLAIPDITTDQVQKLKAFLDTLKSSPVIKVNAFSHHAVKGEAKQWRNLSQEERDSIGKYLGNP